MQYQQSGPPESSLGRKLYSTWNKNIDVTIVKDKTIFSRKPTTSNNNNILPSTHDQKPSKEQPTVLYKPAYNDRINMTPQKDDKGPLYSTNKDSPHWSFGAPYHRRTPSNTNTHNEQHIPSIDTKLKPKELQLVIPKHSPSRISSSGQESQWTTASKIKLTPDITISPQEKNKILIGKSLLDLQRNKHQKSQSIQLEPDLYYMKNERGHINIIHDDPEWGSDISSVPVFDQFEDDETVYDFANKKSWFGEEGKTLYKKVQPQKGLRSKEKDNGSEQGILGLKKFLLSKDNPTTPGNKNDKMLIQNNNRPNTPLQQKEYRKISPSPIERKKGIEETVVKKKFTYNPFAEAITPQAAKIEEPKVEIHNIPVIKREEEAPKRNLGILLSPGESTTVSPVRTPKNEVNNSKAEIERRQTVASPTRRNRVSFHAKNLKGVSLSKQSSTAPVIKLEQASVHKHPISLGSFFKAIRRLKRALRARYLKNRKEVYKYDPREDPPARRVMRRNKDLRDRRDRHKKQDQAFEEKIKKKQIEECEQDFFDFTGYHSLFNPKVGIRVPANATNPGLGKINKAGFIQKVTNKSKTCHQRWLILRSFHLYWYTSPNVYLPQGVLPLPTLPLLELDEKLVNNRCLLIQAQKGRELAFFYDDDWKAILSNEMGNKRYNELMFEQKKAYTIPIIEYFEDQDIKTLNLANENIQDAHMYTFFFDSLRFHPKLKELNFSKCQVNNERLKDLIQNLKTQKKTNKLEVLVLDSNMITEDMVTDIADYLEADISFSLKKFSVNYNPIGDHGVQTLLESMLTRFERMNAEKKKVILLPFTELGLSGTRMADQSVFTLTTVFQEINKKLGEKGFEDHKELMKLEMGFNMISDNGLNALSKSLTTFNGICELDLSSNLRLTGAYFDNLMSNLKHNTSLSKLDYRKNAVSVKGLESLFFHLNENFLLKRLMITINQKLIEAFVGMEDVIMDFYKIVLENQ